MDKLIRLYLFKRNDYDAVKSFIKSELPEYDFREDEYGNMYGTFPGSDSKACISAHLDQVEAGDIAKVCEYNGYLFGEDKDGMPANLGADDKNGVWVAINAAKHKTHPKLAFFLDEEVGRLGSKQADADFFKDVAFTLVIDRKGNQEIVWAGHNRVYATMLHILFKKANPEWNYGTGVSCDADSIRKYCDVVNLSCGYYKAHTKLEYTCFAELEETLRAVNKFLSARFDQCPIYDDINDFRMEQFCMDDLAGAGYGR